METQPAPQPSEARVRFTGCQTPQAGPWMSVLGAVERGGDVRAQVADDLTGRGILDFLMRNVELESSLLVTDEYGGYEAVDDVMPHISVSHSEH